MPMNYANYAKELAKDQRVPRTKVCRVPTPSSSFDLKISLKIEEKNFATPWLCVRSDLKSKIPI